MLICCAGPDMASRQLRLGLPPPHGSRGGELRAGGRRWDRPSGQLLGESLRLAIVVDVLWLQFHISLGL